MDYKRVVRGLLANRNIPFNHKLNFIKQNVSAGEYKDALKIHPSLMAYLTSNYLFETVEQISLKDPFHFTGDFKKEFKWAVNIVEHYLEYINKFIGYKNHFDSAFLLQKYSESQNILTIIEKEFGICLWTIEANFRLVEYIEGTEKNWELLSFYLNKINNPFYDFIINAYSKRVEKGLPYDGYQNQFQNDIDNINNYPFIKDFLVFKCFNIATYEYDFSNLESVLFFSNILNPIDQYLLVIDVILYILSTTNEFDKIILPFIKNARNTVINDFRLSNILNVLATSTKPSISEHQQYANNCLNSYYSGDFQSSLSESNEAIKHLPLEFEFFEIYCKSLISLNKEFSPTGISDFIDEILLNIYNILSFKKIFQNERLSLLKSSLLLIDLGIGKQIYSLLSEIEVLNERSFIVSALSAFVNSPKNLLLERRKENIYHNFSSLIDENYGFKVFVFKAGNSVDNTEIKSKSLAQETSIKAINLISRNDYINAIVLLSDAKELDENMYYYERKVSLLFISYLNSGQIREALVLFGKIFFDEVFITGKLNYDDIFNKIRATGFENFSDLIELPILYSLIKKEYDLYEVADEFLCANDIFSINEIDIDEFVAKFSLNKTIYFINKVLTVNTLKYSTDYGSINVVEEERVSLLNKLLLINSNDKLEYEKEINDIYRINSVRKVIKEVDEGRLYIDVKNLKDLQVKSFNDIFSRFRDISLSSGNKNLIAFNTANVRNWDIEKQEKNELKDEYSSADYIAFKNMYLVSRDNFLFSKEYGLDSCLSTRIRHGALKNHIRSVFEKLNLVTSKYNDKYVDNKIWENQLRFNPALNVLVQERLKVFSKEIDDYTEYIVNNLIQIQTEKLNDKPDGLFTYFTNDEVLYHFYGINKYLLTSIESTVDRLLATLVSHTLTDVGRTILKAFTDTIPKIYQNIIEKAITELRDLEGINYCDIVPNLTKSSTDIQLELEYLSNWFYLNTTSSASLLPLETILDASIELTNKINPTFNLYPDVSIGTDLLGFSNLIFVFNIMLNNAMSHSKLASDKLHLKIDVGLHEDGEHVFVNFIHKLDTSHDYTSNREKLNHVKQNWNDHSNIDRSNKEGESGYDKIKRILVYEALAKTQLFDFDMSNEQLSISLFLPYNPNKE